jgi:hypothetical protein
MTTVRPYRHEEDYERVGAFPVRRASTGAPRHNCLPASRVPMHVYPILDRSGGRRAVDPALCAGPRTSSPLEEP